jgi:serine/threonine protein kinase/tetratricopeptide (TPR) repeat protein
MTSDDYLPDAEVTLPPPGDDETSVHLDMDETLGAEEVGEGTMDSVSIGLLGSGPVRAVSRSDVQEDPDATMVDSSPSGSGPIGALHDSGPVEAELVESRSRSDIATVKYSSAELGHSDSALGSSEETLAIGQETLADIHANKDLRQLGDFELERKVGQGGMGEVWLARQLSLDRPVAVKVLPRSLATQENFIERFQREAKAAASLVHPNVIQIYAYGIDEGTPYFAMEYVEGEDLQQRMRRSQLDWAEIVDMMIGVGSALSIAHEKGIIHRDIKPSNVMLDKTGLVKVMDFGLAKATSGGPEAKSLTSAGLIMGTPNYLSPEQGRGDPLDGRSDLYSLGIVFYELLTGSLPFRADTPAGLIFKHVYEPPPPPLDVNPDLPPFLVEMTLKLLEKDPDDRYSNSGEFLADLGEFIDNYDYYVEDAGERRPGSGYQDPDRINGSGSHKIRGNKSTGKRRVHSDRSRRASSDRHGAVTEGVTAPVNTHYDTAPTEAALKAESGRYRDVEPLVTAPARRPRPAPPPKKSKAPLLFLFLLVSAAGFGYAYKYENEWLMKTGQSLGLVTVSPNGNGTGGVVPPETGTKGVAYVYTGSWPDGQHVKLVTPTSKQELSKGIEGRYAQGSYTFELTRPGYRPSGWPVTLIVGPSGKGLLVDADGANAASVEPSWQATEELSGAYARGLDALNAGKLGEAKAALAEAARLDPAYFPSGEDASTVAELQEELGSLLAAQSQAESRADTVIGIARKYGEQKIWRTALMTLDGLEAEERDSAWSDFREKCQSKVQQGDTFLETVAGAITRGDFAEADENLVKLVAVDPKHPERSAHEGRLVEAKKLRRAALDRGVDESLAATAAELKIYIGQFGTKDSEAKQKLSEVEAQLSAAERLAGEEAALSAVADSGDWARARKLANELLKIDSDNAVAQTVRAKALKALDEGAVLQVVKDLDEALRGRDNDSILRLFDPSSPSYRAERDALVSIGEIEGRFVTSDHRGLEVNLIGDSAQVTGEWEFTLEVLGERPHELRAQHSIQLRRIEKAWLITEVRVDGGEGGVRVRK